jgi:hypothetical protein
MNQFVKRDGLRKHQIVTRWLAVIALLTACTVTFIQHSATFAVTAAIERVEFITSKGKTTNWFLKNAQYIPEYESPRQEFSGYLELGEGVRVTIERVAMGPLYIQVQANTPDQSDLGVLFAEDGSPLGAIHRHALFKIIDFQTLSANGKNVVLPISGDVRLGTLVERPTLPSVPLLRQGQITVIGHSLLGDDLYKGDSQSLDPGDVVEIGNASGPAIGFVAVEEGPALMATFHVVAKNLSVNRLPASGYTVSSTVFSRIKNDGTLQSIWAALLFLLALKRIGAE